MLLIDLSFRSEYFFSFDDKFEIHDDIEILKRMGLLLGKFGNFKNYCKNNNNIFLGLDKGECTYDDIQRAKSMVPKSFQRYIERKSSPHNQLCHLSLLIAISKIISNFILFSFIFSNVPVYGKGKDDSDEWDNTFGEMLDSSLEGGIKSEPYDEQMFDEEENYSENSNME